MFCDSWNDLSSSAGTQTQLCRQHCKKLKSRSARRRRGIDARHAAFRGGCSCLSCTHPLTVRSDHSGKRSIFKEKNSFTDEIEENNVVRLWLPDVHNERVSALAEFHVTHLCTDIPSTTFSTKSNKRPKAPPASNFHGRFSATTSRYYSRCHGRTKLRSDEGTSTGFLTTL